jgi:transcriptional regulator with XRE-family HTH domain
MNDKKNSKKGAKVLDEQQEFIQKICNKLRALREATDFSQETFAYEHGIDRRQWYNMENGVDMRISTLYRGLKALGTTPAEFFMDFI